MNLEHLDATFASLDTLQVETLALYLHPDRRPLRGTAGIIDWRLCGALSAALKSGGLTGKLGERLLMPTHGRIGAKRILVFGAGSTQTPLEAAELGRTLAVAQKAGASELALELPENASQEAIVQALRDFGGKRLVVIGASPALRELLGGARPISRSTKRA